MVNNDRNGEFLRDGMNCLGIRHHLTFDGSASALATIFVDAEGNRAIYMVRGATAESKPAEIRRRHPPYLRAQRSPGLDRNLPAPAGNGYRAFAVRASAFDTPPCSTSKCCLPTRVRPARHASGTRNVR